MRLIVIAAAATLAAVAAWFFIGRDGGSTPTTSVASVMRMVETEAAGDLAAEADYEAFFATLPDALTVSVDSYAAEDGGAVARGLSIMATGDDGREVGVRADEFRAYDLDPEAGAVLAGPADESRRLAGRLDLRGLSVIGLGDVAQAISDEALSAAEEMSGIEQSFDQYDISAARFVADEFTLFGVPATTGDEGKALRGYANLMRAYAFEQAVVMDTVADFAFSQAVEMPAPGSDAADADPADRLNVSRTDGSGKFTIARSGVSGYDRGDFALSFAEGFEGAFSMKDPELGTDVAYDFTADSTTHENVRLADAYAYLARGEFPPSDETGLMSLGVMKLDNMQLTLMDRPFQTISAYELDLSEWHGLLPKRIAFASDETLFVGAMMNMVEGMTDQMAARDGGSPEEAETMRAQMAAMGKILADAGLEELNSENEVTYEWAPGDGATTLRMSSVWEGLGAFRLEGDAALPAYEGFAAIDSDSLGGDDNPLGALMKDETAFDRLVIVMDDQGGLDRLLSAVIAFAELEENAGNQQMAMLRGQDAESVRAMLSMGVSMASAQLAAIAPEAQGMATTAATWLREGGTLTVTIDPETPMTMAEMQALAAMPEGPSGAIATLGLAIEHDAPAE